jgi:hypothetical protein
MCGDGKQAYREVPQTVKTAEQLYKEWWEKKHHDKTESELRAESTD